MDRRDVILMSLALTVGFNVAAGILTLLYANGTSIVEVNPYSEELLQSVGAGAIAVHAVLILAVYPIAFGLSRIISSPNPLFRVKRFYLFIFALMLSILPMGGLVDLLGDVLVIVWSYNGLAGPAKIVQVSLALAFPIALVAASSRWSLSASSGRQV